VTLPRAGRLLAAGALALVASASGAQEPSRFVPWTRETPPLALKDVSGRTINLEDLRGKVVLVNFWATWCEPCREEMPSMLALQRRFAGQPLEVLAVNYGESASRVKEFLARERLPLTTLLDPGQQAARAWRVRVLPGSFLVGRDGRVRFSVIGELDWASEEAIRIVSGMLAAGAAGGGSAGGLASTEHGEETLLQLGRDRGFAKLLRGVDGAAVGVDERDARRTALDVPLDQLVRLGGESAGEVVAEQLGDLTAFHPGSVHRGLHYMWMGPPFQAIPAAGDCRLPTDPVLSPACLRVPRS
jgi:thiol-disulfide isomerase/thioredoxin